MIVETIPSRWFAAGQCWRKTPSSDGTVGRTPEWFITLRMPWKRKMYCITRDEPIKGHTRLVIRIKAGWVVDAGT